MIYRCVIVDDEKPARSRLKRLLAGHEDFEIVGEAAYQVSQATRNSLPGIPWEDIIGMRHRLVHAYFDINLDILWQTLQNDLPPLVVELERALPEEPL